MSLNQYEIESTVRSREESTEGGESMEYQVCEAGLPANGDRLHTCVEGRFVTLFRHNNRLSAIDSVCHHAGGPQ
jgi:nitrite reductase/ring-hydroxylating ferredoxin subunit